MRRVITILSAGVFLAAPLHALAAPWLGAGDARARHSIQKLSDRGHLGASTTTWPINWADVERGLGESSDSSVATQRAYLAFERDQQAESGFRGELTLEGSNEPAFLRGFYDLPREEGQFTATLQWQGEAWADRKSVV